MVDSGGFAGVVDRSRVKYAVESETIHGSIGP